MQTTFSISTQGPGLYSFTQQVADWVTGDGLLTLLVRHTSASLLIMENADPDVQTDIVAYLDRRQTRRWPTCATSTKARTTCRRI